jgi:hypothetical protein
VGFVFGFEQECTHFDVVTMIKEQEIKAFHGMNKKKIFFCDCSFFKILALSQLQYDQGRDVYYSSLY